MSPRDSSFVRALKDAEKRLGKALAEQGLIRQKAADLAQEIPALQHTIRTLQMLLNKEVPLATPAVTGAGEHRAETSADLQSLAGPQDLSGMGSNRDVPTDDEFLPEPDGTPIIE